MLYMVVGTSQVEELMGNCRWFSVMATEVPSLKFIYPTLKQSVGMNRTFLETVLFIVARYEIRILSVQDNRDK